MTDKTIFACLDPVNAHWRLGPLPPVEGRLILIGWQMPVNPVDSGVPEEVGAALARALTSIARVDFPVSKMNHDASNEWGNDAMVRSLGSGSLIERAAAALKHEPQNVTLISTRSEKIAACLFEDPGYPWCLQGQVAMLSEREAIPQQIDRQALRSLIHDDWARHAMRLRSCGIAGVLRPGVDGDVVGIFAMTNEFMQTLLEALEREARRARFAWLLLFESDFINLLGSATGMAE